MVLETFFDENKNLSMLNYQPYHDLYESLIDESTCKQNILECFLISKLFPDPAYLTLLFYYQADLPRLENQTNQLYQKYTNIPPDFRNRYPDDSLVYRKTIKRKIL